MNSTIKLAQLNKGQWYGVIKTDMYPYSYYAGPVIDQGECWCPAQTASHLWHETVEAANKAFLGYVDPPTGMRGQMRTLCEFVSANWHEGIEHWDLCHVTALRFDLYENDKFPTWLSRVVAGIMQDASEGIKDD